VGLWREHLPYNSVIDITTDERKIYAATPYSLYSVDRGTNSIERYSKVTGLHETGISRIAYDNTGEKLLIAYTNSNVDILYRNDIINIPDIKRSAISGDKTIYDIFIAGNRYYFSTGLGIVVIDAERYEVKDTWFIGAGGNPSRVSSFATSGSFFYAATEEGLKRVSATNSNPADHTNWTLVSGTNGLPAGAYQQVLSTGNTIIARQNGSLYILNGNSWTLFYTSDWPILDCNSSHNQLLLCQRKPTGESRVAVLDPNGNTTRIVMQPTVISLPRKAILFNNEPWVGDEYGGLSHFTTSSFEQYQPNSPESIASGEMLVYNTVFYATAGAVNDAWNYQYNGNGIYQFKAGSWTNINRYRFPPIDTLLDYITIAADRRDGSIWAGSYGGGLLHVKEGPAFEIFKQHVFAPAIGDPGSYRIAGLAFDADNNLWVSNYGAAQPLLVRKADGNWQRFTVPFFLFENALTQVIIDNNNYKWIVVTKNNTLLCFDHGASIDNTGDDRWESYRPGTGNGNLPDGDVLCAAKDKTGFIWVGTTNGIGVIECTADVFSSRPCDAVWPIIKTGNFAGYLFSGQEVRSIAVDGANRKWVATRNGLWLINAEGSSVIYNFTEENSPLLSNDVKKIAIDGQTGEVYIATAKGICSFRSTATEATDKNEQVLVFPNPVAPGYTGTIAIRGVANNAVVKITELNGRLVYQTRALGGQAVWDGKDYRGQRISSGVYLVLITGETADTGVKPDKAAARIIFVSK